MPSLSQSFQNTFEILPADTPRLLEECFKVRYQILCQEGRIPGFQANDYPDRLESDEFDQRSVHMLLLHRPSGRTIGTVRLVISTGSKSPFPLETCPQDAFYPGMANIIDENRGWLTEISRLFILPEFRGRQNDSLLWGSQPEDQPDKRLKKLERRKLHPIVGLFKAILMVSTHYNLRCLCAVMEPRLAALMSGFGILMRPLGETIAYHGRRRVYFASLDDILDNIHKNHKDIWELLTEYGKLQPSTVLDRDNVSVQVQAYR